MTLRVRVLSREQILAGGAEGADGIISVRGTGTVRGQAELDLALTQAVMGEVGAVLPLRFDDIGIAEYGPQRGPTDEHVAEALAFVRALRDRQADALLCIHCEMGRSRSSALGLMALAEDLGPGQEAEAVAALSRMDMEEIMIPNPLLVRLADDQLWRYGALEAALAEASPRYAQVREHWRVVGADPEAAWKESLAKRRKRKKDDTLDPVWD
ncbi:hypothetical protein [Azospirillum sp. SYSU D00513]|uniref:hypothetical protein n=1 Tax=Azospirillum sp. SYSU D00513 TaxID=2812561 RepID=UPI001A97C4D1|nr:hypothetical protein [Azospirillum sp. SYSU D00513]